MRIVTLLLLVVLLGACGYKGPLYLPKPKTEPQPAPAAVQPDRQTGARESAGK